MPADVPSPAEPVQATSADVYLDAARASVAARGWTYPTPEREREALDMIAGRPAIRAAVDATRAPLLAENAELRRRLATVENDAAQWFRIATEARAEAEQFHARLAADGFVAYTREQAEAWRTVEAERDQTRASLAGAVAANDALAAENAEVHAALTDMVHVATCVQAGCGEPAHTTEVGRAGDRLAADIDRLVAEVVRLRTAALPEGGKWVTDYGHDPAQVAAHGIEWHPGLHCVRDTYRRRVWYGPVEPVDGTEASGG